MSTPVNLLQNIINNLSTRERVLVLLGVLSIIYVLWDTFLVTPIQSSNKKLINERMTIQEQMTTLQTRSLSANGLLKNSKRKQILGEIQAVEKQINTFDSEILERLQGRVAPEFMSSLLNDVLQKNQDLELISIHNLPAIPFADRKKDKKDKDEPLSVQEKQPAVDPKLVGIFMHPLEIQLQGRYLDVLSYLEALENMGWKVFWDQVRLEVVEYPKVKVHIKVHTFSLKDGWLSV